MGELTRSYNSGPSVLVLVVAAIPTPSQGLGLVIIFMCLSETKSFFTNVNIWLNDITMIDKKFGIVMSVIL